MEFKSSSPSSILSNLSTSKIMKTDNVNNKSIDGSKMHKLINSSIISMIPSSSSEFKIEFNKECSPIYNETFQDKYGQKNKINDNSILGKVCWL